MVAKDPKGTKNKPAKKPAKRKPKKVEQGAASKKATSAKASARSKTTKDNKPQGKAPNVDHKDLAQQINRARDMVLARFAQVTMSFMGVPRYAHQSIKDLQQLAMVPLMRERIAIATVAPANDDGAKPAGAGSLTNPLIGIALWANVSEEVDAKIRDQAAAEIFPVKLNAQDWTSDDIVWLLDVIAPSQKLSAQVLASFKQVLADKLPDRKSKDVKLHPIIKKMIGDDVLAKMGARDVGRQSNKPAVKTKIVNPKKKAMSGVKKAKTKKVVN